MTLRDYVFEISSDPFYCVGVLWRFPGPVVGNRQPLSLILLPVYAPTFVFDIRVSA